MRQYPPKSAPSRDKMPIERNFAICFSTARELTPILLDIASAEIEGSEMTKSIIFCQ